MPHFLTPITSHFTSLHPTTLRPPPHAHHFTPHHLTRTSRPTPSRAPPYTPPPHTTISCPPSHAHPLLSPQARVKLQQRSYVESEGLLRLVLAQNPHHQEALFQLSLLYTHTNRTQDALSLARLAAHNCSRPPTLCAHLHAHYGDLLNDRNNVDQAAQSYQLAVELEPTLTHAHVNLGALYHTKGDYARAWRHYLTAHGQEPSNSLLLENMEKLRRAQNLQQATTSMAHCLNKS
ncbi:protein O-mannosyl-transferase TMTC1-like [Penaeus monodon]|uniref:protein O-mannosyl-transferase TMTC1-like n=1 Tax=Penaeus monodon TaxID=6687 RepID=UPI0018A701A7|nr:protein O-mannosyl-transferase TMTC1-like [Penaeus monodon]